VFEHIHTILTDVLNRVVHIGAAIQGMAMSQAVQTAKLDRLIQTVDRLSHSGTGPGVTKADLLATETRIMSALSDKLAEATTKVDSAINRVQADVAALKAQIADLQAKVDAGGATQADLDALQALEDKVDSLDPTSPSTL
jgi:predicted  nucleic acid-binding Zn-ribbon protein